jgi:glyoxylase-like metal-dependent hydrolase (beta-lactamase superfamily II)
MTSRDSVPTRAARWLCTLFAAGVLHAVPAEAQGTRPPAADEIYAVQYGTLAQFPVQSLIAGADSARRLDVALMVWVIKRANGEVWLVDAGFYRDKFVQRWKPRDYQTPAAAVAMLGIAPEQVTDIIVSHVHWDHVDGADLFPRARVWIQREEFAHHVGENGAVLDRAVDALDATMLWSLRQAGRVRLVDGDAQTIAPGITVYTGGRHTFASQYVRVESPAGAVLLASDNAYLYENLATRRPIAQTLDSVSNLAAQARMQALAGSTGVIIPGHDPAVMQRFPVVKPGVVRIR